MMDKHNMNELNRVIDRAKDVENKEDAKDLDFIERMLNEVSKLSNLMKDVDKLDNDINQQIDTYASILALMRYMDETSNTDKETNSDTDKINHPNHYIKGGSIECIDEMVEVFGVRATMDFCLCNVWKYRRRALYKNGEEDMAKADFYMNKFIELKSKNIYKK